MVNAFDPENSNWLRYVNCAMTENSGNLESVQYNGEIYYEVKEDIPEGIPIL